RQGSVVRRPRGRTAHPGARGVAGGVGRRRDLRPLGRQRVADGQAAAAVLARRARRPDARHPCARHHLPRVVAELAGRRAPDGPAAGSDLVQDLGRLGVSDLKSLGYITVSTTDIEAWRTFAFDVLGFAEGSPPSGKGADPSALYLRMDERAARIVVIPGETDRVVTVGWEVRDRAALKRVRAALDGAGAEYTKLPLEETEARRVEE